MTVLLIEPHMDDAALFASYTILGEKPIVCTVFGDITDNGKRMAEHVRALESLGALDQHQSMVLPEKKPNWERVKKWMEDLNRGFRPWTVYAPAYEEGGHEQHNEVARLAAEVFGGAEILSYMTYVRGGRRSRGTIEVEPEHGWSALKFQAMACYTSQIEWAQTRPWFAADDALREWIA